MSNALDEREIERILDRLPEQILVSGRIYKLQYGYWEGDDVWWLSYSSYAKWPGKKVFLHREESTLKECVFGAWRNLALKKDEWKLIEQAIEAL